MRWLIALVMCISAVCSGHAQARYIMHAQAPDGSWAEHAHDPVADRIMPGALMMLSMMGAGYDHSTPSRYRAVMRRGIDWHLDAIQMESLDTGRLALHAHVLCEAYAITLDSAIREDAQTAIEALVHRRTTLEGVPGMAWANAQGELDARLTTWCVLACLAAQLGNVETGTALADVSEWHQWLIEQTVLIPYADERAVVFPLTVRVGEPLPEFHGDAPAEGLLLAFLLTDDRTSVPAQVLLCGRSTALGHSSTVCADARQSTAGL